MWKLEVSIVVFLMMVRLTGVADCVLVATSTLVLPFAKVSIVPERGSADPMGIDVNTLRTINRARMAEREALACACGRTGGIGLRTISGGYVAFGVTIEKISITNVAL